MNKPKVFVTFPKDFLPLLDDLLKEKCDVEYSSTFNTTEEEVLQNVKGKFAVISGFVGCKYGEKVFHASGGSLRVLSCCSAGYDHVDVTALKSLGVRIGVAANANSESTAETAIGLLIVAARRLFQYSSLYRSVKPELWRPQMLHTNKQGLENSTVGIVGCGRIGMSVARKLNAFRIKRLLYFSRSEKPEALAIGGELKSVEDIMKESDFIVVSIALNKDTEKIISRHMISLMKPTSVLVNVGRGGLIDQDALVEALQADKIRAAALDVVTPYPLPLDHPLFKLDNVFLTPHIAASSDESHRKIAVLTAKNVLAVLDEVPMPYEI